MNDSLQRLLAKVPRLRDALQRVPHVRDGMKKVTGRSVVVWDPTNLSDLTNRFTCAGLQLELEALKDRIVSLEEERDDLARKYEASRAGEASWACRFVAGDQLVFGNAAGERAKLSLQLARQMVRGRLTNLVDVTPRGDEMLFIKGANVVGRIPRSLWAVLERVLLACSWLQGTPLALGNGTPTPTTPAGVPGRR